MKKTTLTALAVIALLGTARAEMLVYFNYTGGSLSTIGGQRTVTYIPTTVSPNFHPSMDFSDPQSQGSGFRTTVSSAGIVSPGNAAPGTGGGADKALTLSNFALPIPSAGNSNYSIFVGLSTLNFSDLTLSFNYYSANNFSPTGATLSYSIDGTNFNTISSLAFTRGGTTFTNLSFDLSSIDALENAGSVQFQISGFTRPSGTPSANINTTGQFRFDDFTLSGTYTAPGALTPIPEPMSLALPLFGMVATGAWYIKRRRSVEA